jgi:hypothetical protein
VKERHGGRGEEHALDKRDAMEGGMDVGEDKDMKVPV